MVMPGEPPQYSYPPAAPLGTPGGAGHYTDADPEQAKRDAERRKAEEGAAPQRARLAFEAEKQRAQAELAQRGQQIEALRMELAQSLAEEQSRLDAEYAASVLASEGAELRAENPYAPPVAPPRAFAPQGQAPLGAGAALTTMPRAAV